MAPKRRPGKRAGARACRALWTIVRGLVLILRAIEPLKVFEPEIDKIRFVSRLGQLRSLCLSTRQRWP